jgi:hypothetical protein
MAITSRALAFASRWFDPATVHRVFEPLIADWQREWIDAPIARRHWTITRGLASFAMTFLMLVPRALLFSPAPQVATRRVATSMLIFISVACGCLAIPFLVDLRHAAPERQAWLLLLLLPSSVAFVFPFAASYVVDHLRSGPDVSFAERLAVARLAIGAALFVFLFGGWVVPPMNQVFRVDVRGYDIPAPNRGVRELTTAELIFAPSRAAAFEPYTGGADRQSRVAAEVQNRAFLIALPILLVWLRWKALERPRQGWCPLPAAVSAIVMVVAVMTLYFSGWRIEKELALAAGTGHWLPPLALVVWGWLTPYRRRFFIRQAA